MEDYIIPDPYYEEVPFECLVEDYLLPDSFYIDDELYESLDEVVDLNKVVDLNEVVEIPKLGHIYENIECMVVVAEVHVLNEDVPKYESIDSMENMYMQIIPPLNSPLASKHSASSTASTASGSAPGSASSWATEFDDGDDAGLDAGLDGNCSETECF